MPGPGKHLLSETEGGVDGKQKGVLKKLCQSKTFQNNIPIHLNWNVPGCDDQAMYEYRHLPLCTGVTALLCPDRYDCRVEDKDLKKCVQEWMEPAGYVASLTNLTTYNLCNLHIH